MCYKIIPRPLHNNQNCQAFLTMVPCLFLPGPFVPTPGRIFSGQNTLRDSGKRKISSIWARDAGFFCLSVSGIREISLFVSSAFSHQTKKNQKKPFLQCLKTPVNSKYQSKWPIYILHLLAFTAIGLFYKLYKL